MKKFAFALIALCLVLLIPLDITAQEPTSGNPQDTVQYNPQEKAKVRTQSKFRPYLNLGYITNLQKCSECTQRDQG